MAPHPLRRISTGSLSSLARSTDRLTTSPSGLDHLQGALHDLVDEAATLGSHIEKMTVLHDALGTFNESFAAYLYALKMNAFCVEWPMAPDENSFRRVPDLNPPAPVQLKPPPTPPSSQSHSQPSSHAADLTYATAYSTSTDDLPPPRPKPALKKPAQTQNTAKKAAMMKKKRELEIAGIIDTLPLEYRGSQPANRMGMEKVIAKLMDSPGGLPIKDMVAPPDLPQPRVNKCLIALTSKKIVSKISVEGTTWYRWVGP
ncbi:DASH complex subunit DAM1, partial [Tremellales sp. Uapishka_1]